MSEQAHHYAVAREIDLNRVREICAAYSHLSPEEALMPVFQELQEEFGFVNDAAAYEVAQHLHLSPTQIYASLTFYSIYKWRTGGQHRIFLCEGSGCYAVGTTKLRRVIQDRLGIGAGETTFDGKVTFQPFSTCMGACEWAPLVEIDGEFFGHVDVAKINQLIDEMLRKDYAEAQAALAAPSTENSQGADTSGVAQETERAPSMIAFNDPSQANSGGGADGGKGR